MAYGFPSIGFTGLPVSIPCAGHAGLGVREATRGDAPAILEHLRRLAPVDRRMRFGGGVADSVLERHVAGFWPSGKLVLAAFDGPMWASPLHPAGPVRALAELAIAGGEAELGLSVEEALRRRRVGTCLVRTAARLLALRGVRRIRAHTLAENASFLTLARRWGAAIAFRSGEVEVTFAIPELHRPSLRRRAAQVFRLAG